MKTKWVKVILLVMVGSVIGLASNTMAMPKADPNGECAMRDSNEPFSVGAAFAPNRMVCNRP
jgi:hypothetical protein